MTNSHSGLISRNAVLAIFFLFALPAYASERYQAEKDPDSPPEIAYVRYFTKDRFNRRITFYLTKTATDAPKLPLVVSILGSGCYSNFFRKDEWIVLANRSMREDPAGRVYALVVEKPGVKFLDHPQSLGTARFASEEFRREMTLERWSEAVSAALRAARTLPFVDTSRTLVVGHSEGGLVACRVAAENAFVTHVASLSGGGPTQLYDFLRSARRGEAYPERARNPEKQVQELLTEWSTILKDPESTTKEFSWHTYRYWSSFMKTSSVEELQRTNACVYLALGTAEGDDAIASFDVVYAELLAKGRDVTAELVKGADHGFGFADDPNRDGLREVFDNILTWFLRPAH